MVSSNIRPSLDDYELIIRISIALIDFSLNLSILLRAHFDSEQYVDRS